MLGMPCPDVFFHAYELKRRPPTYTWHRVHLDGAISDRWATAVEGQGGGGVAGAGAAAQWSLNHKWHCWSVT